MTIEQPGDHNDPSMFDPEPLDPVVARRFELLDQVEVPEPGPARLASAAYETSRTYGRGRFAVALAAAAAAVIAATGAFIATIDGDDGTVETAIRSAQESGDGGSAEPVESGASSLGTTVLKVEDDSPLADTRASDVDLVEGGEPHDAERMTTISAAAQPADQRGGEEGSEHTTSTTAGTVVPTKPHLSVPPTIDPVPTVSVPRPGELVRKVSGMVTEVMIDCQRHLVLNDQGQVVEGDTVVCDGGSYIVIDDIRIFTSSGFGLPEDSYNRHPESIKPGQRVTAIAREIGPGIMVLDCETCTIQMG